MYFSSLVLKNEFLLSKQLYRLHPFSSICVIILMEEKSERIQRGVFAKIVRLVESFKQKLISKKTPLLILFMLLFKLA